MKRNPDCVGDNTAKNFVLQLGSLVSLYLSLTFLLVLSFGLINLLIPDATDTVWQIEGANSMVRLGIAMVAVFGPTYIILAKNVNQSRRLDQGGKYLMLTKWLIYLSLLLGGIVLLIDFVVVIMAFLEGEITTRFILKALAVFIAIGAAFYYYLKDAQGYWLEHEEKSKVVGLIALLVAMAVVITGFVHVNSPTEVRQAKLDEKQLDDLQQIQWQIQDYLVLEGTLPTNLDALSTALLPEAPAGREAYIYTLTETGFSLCAEFATATEGKEYYYARPITHLDSDTPVIINPDNWQHGAGMYCFERVVKTRD
jgi:hypothetical protein